VKTEAIFSFVIVTFLLASAFPVGALSGIVPDCIYTLTVHVVDANTNSSISNATVIALGPQNLSGTTDGGTVVFNNIPTGNYTVTASKIGYTSASTVVVLDTNKEITLALALSAPPVTVIVIIEPERVPLVAGTDPDTLNLMRSPRSGAIWVNCSITLPEGYNASDVNTSTVLMNGTVPADLGALRITNSCLVVRFNRTLVSDLILSKSITRGNVTLTVTAQLLNGTMIEGSDTIGVKMPGDANMDGKVDILDCIVASNAFGSCPEDPNWNSAADENDDGIVNIFDVIAVAGNFGKTYP
jgi:hypothetical protein